MIPRWTHWCWHMLLSIAACFLPLLLNVTHQRKKQKDKLVYWQTPISNWYVLKTCIYALDLVQKWYYWHIFVSLSWGAMLHTCLSVYIMLRQAGFWHCLLLWPVPAMSCCQCQGRGYSYLMMYMIDGECRDYIGQQAWIGQYWQLTGSGNDLWLPVSGNAVENTGVLLWECSWQL